MTSSFQPVQYQKYARPEGFDPIQTPNVAPAIAREGQNVLSDMKTANLTEQQNYKTQILNQQIQQEGLDKLAQFSTIKVANHQALLASLTHWHKGFAKVKQIKQL